MMDDCITTDYDCLWTLLEYLVDLDLFVVVVDDRVYCSMKNARLRDLALHAVW